MDNNTHTPVPAVAWALTLDDGMTPATTIEQARLVADALGGVIRPTAPETDATDGVWLCDTDPSVFQTLVEVGWCGLEADDLAAEAEWPDA
jgi:hypothetical protein